MYEHQVITVVETALLCEHPSEERSNEDVRKTAELKVGAPFIGIQPHQCSLERLLGLYYSAKSDQADAAAVADLTSLRDGLARFRRRDLAERARTADGTA